MSAFLSEDFLLGDHLLFTSLLLCPFLQENLFLQCLLSTIPLSLICVFRLGYLSEFNVIQRHGNKLLAFDSV